jgi:hypothetical protein
VAVQTRPVRRPFRNLVARRDEGPDHRLSYLDQALFLGLRATGQAAVMQCVWIYEHAVDLDGLRRFHRNFGYGIAGRRIEPSPLPFGRHRWVSSLGPPADIDIDETPRPREELSDWADERVQLPIDPEHGPGWHLGVQRFTDGATAVSLVGSHCLGDGSGALLTVYNAVTGNLLDFGYEPPGSRTTMRGIASDLRQVVRDAPEIGRTLRAAAKVAFRRRGELTPKRSTDPAPVFGADAERHVVVPAVSAWVDVDHWDARAEALNGNNHSLLAGFAAKLGQKMGRHRDEDGAVPLIIPINDRTLEDTRANAVMLANACVDPTDVTSDLSHARAAVKAALTAMRETPDETLALLPLTPFIPKAAVRKTADVAFGFSGLPVSCSNVGDLPSEILRIDGTEAEYAMLRGIDRHIPRRVLEERRGLLTVVGGRIGGKVTIAVVGYQPGEENSKSRLRELVAATLSDFGLRGVIV